MTEPKVFNAPAPNTPYFTPAQIPAAGTAVNPQPDGKPIPKLFQPLKVRGVEFHNRIWVSTCPIVTRCGGIRDCVGHQN